MGGRIEHTDLELSSEPVLNGLRAGGHTRRGFLKACFGIGAGLAMPGIANAAQSAQIDRELTVLEEAEHRIFSDLNKIFKPYLEGQFKYYVPHLQGNKSPYWEKKSKELDVKMVEFEDIKYPLRSGEKVVKSPFDIAVKAEGSVGKIGRGTDRTKVIAVIKSGTPLIVGPQNKLLEIAACANPVYEYRLLCTKDIKMKDGSVKKFLYMPISSTDAKFEDADGVVRDIAQMSELTGTEIKFTK